MYEYCYSNLGAIYAKGLCPSLRDLNLFTQDCNHVNKVKGNKTRMRKFKC